MKVADPLPWFEFETGEDAPPWRMSLATERGCPDLQGHAGLTYRDRYRAGYTYRDQRLIVVSVHVPEQIDEHAFHEMGHVLLDRINWPPKTRVGKKLVWIHPRTEERIVSLAEPRLVTIAKDLGWKLPRKPRGFSELCHKADRINEARGE